MAPRVLFIRPGPQFSVQDVFYGWRDALRELGCLVADLNYDDRIDFYARARIQFGTEYRQPFSIEEAIRLAAKGIEAACYELWPDIVIAVMGTFVPNEMLDLMRQRGHKVVVIGTESPYEDDRQLELAQVVDLMILNDPINLERFRAVNPNTYYVPHAYDPHRHYPGAALDRLRCDFCFVGTGFQSRIDLLEAVDWEGLDVLLGGMWKRLDPHSPLAKFVGHNLEHCMDNDEAADLYRSARSSLNLYRREHNDEASCEGVSIGPREVELAACECFFLRDPRPEGDEVFSMLPTFTEAAEIRPLLDWWLSHDRPRELAAERARAAIVDRTFGKNAEWLLNHLY